jgi:outer membrane protein insertion porin family
MKSPGAQIEEEIDFALLYNSRVLRCAASLLAVLLTCLPGLAQKSSKSKLSYKLLSIHVTGLSHSTADEVIAASGLKVGQLAEERDFKQASEKLGETGLFTSLAYTFHYSLDGCNVEFEISENPDLLPIIFDNLVWFSDNDLISQLHARLPLFNGQLPVSGNLADQVADALNAILAERHIAGKAEYSRSADFDGPVNSYIYSLKLHPILVRNTDFPGASPEVLPALQAAAKPLLGQEFLRSKLAPQEKFNFLPIYLARGYLKAAFSDPQVKVAQDGAKTLVDLSLPVDSGKQYKLASLQWQGNGAFPSEKLQELVHLRAGDPVNAVQLQDDLEAVQKLYGTRGYLFARVDPSPALDDAQSTASYELNVTEGEQYHMGDLELDGLPPDTTARMTAQWQMKKGQPYDKSYLQRFFNVMYRDTGLHRPYNVVPKESINQQEKTVSVALHFMPKT